MTYPSSYIRDGKHLPKFYKVYRREQPQVAPKSDFLYGCKYSLSFKFFAASSYSKELQLQVVCQINWLSANLLLCEELRTPMLCFWLFEKLEKR